MTTFTPAPPAVCPQAKAGLSFHAPDTEDYGEAFESVLNFLNQGGSIEVLHTALSEPKEGASWWTLQGSAQSIEDLTGDGVSEVMLISAHGSSQALILLRCERGSYEVIHEEEWQIGDRGLPKIHSIQDVNGNGIRELRFEIWGGHGAYHWEGTDIYEWNGREMAKVLEASG